MRPRRRRDLVHLRRIRVLRALAVAVVAMAAALANCSRPGDAADSGGNDGALRRLFDDVWDDRMIENPLFATAVGDHRFDHLLPSVARKDQQRRAAKARGFLERLESLEGGTLGRQHAINLAILRRQLEDEIASVEFGAYEIPFLSDSGFHSGFARLPASMPLAGVKDYENYIARLEAFPALVEQHVTNMRAGMSRGFTMPRVVIDGFLPTVDPHVVGTAEESLLWAPFEAFPDTVASADRERLRTSGRAAIETGVVPAFRLFRDFLRDEYQPAARETIGASKLPDGRSYYEQRVRYFTTLALTPEEIHETGLAEVKRIRSEMEAIIRTVGFRGTFDQFLDFLRTAPRFYAEEPDELLMRAAYIAKRMDGQLPRLFGRLPRLPYTVEPVPEHLAPNYTGGRYVPSPIGSTRPGTYWVNTFKLESRPFYTQQALTLHEAVPGHHLQNAIAQEQGEQPAFRRHDYISAYGEGWGLYSEWLGLEAGFYTDPYDDFGRLTYEMWRACRLVVDTGIHAMGWSRQQTIDLLAGNTALSLHEIRTETDRYISWPGQALSYKIGELKIKELRREATRQLGHKFDLRGFHDTVLATGSVPLPVLEDEVRAWVDRVEAGAPRAEMQR